MAIQCRRGPYADFDPTKLLPGEWAVVVSGDPEGKDGRSVFMCFASGYVKRMCTYEDVDDIIFNYLPELSSRVRDILNIEITSEQVETLRLKLSDDLGSEIESKVTLAKGQLSAELTEEIEERLKNLDISGGTSSTVNLDFVDRETAIAAIDALF